MGLSMNDMLGMVDTWVAEKLAELDRVRAERDALLAELEKLSVAVRHFNEILAAAREAARARGENGGGANMGEGE